MCFCAAFLCEINNNNNNNWRRASIPDGQASTSAWWRHCSETVFFRDNLVIFCHRSKRIAFLESLSFSTCVYMQIFNFRYGHVTAFWHPPGAYICQMPGHRLSRLAKGTSSESRLSIGTIGLGETVSCRIVEGYPKTRKMLFLDLAFPTLQNSGIFHDSIRPHLHFDGLPPKSRRSVISI